MFGPPRHERKSEVAWQSGRRSSSLAAAPTYTALMGLKRYDADLTAIVSMADNGGSTGVLRDEYGAATNSTNWIRMAPTGRPRIPRIDTHGADGRPRIHELIRMAPTG